MLTRSNDTEVFNAIIVFIKIDVMHNLTFF